MFKKILLGLVLATTAMGAARIKNADIASDAAIVDTKLNTISTAGKVSNSATTATSANTASAIVARNASGAFYASTISADLVGNVTGNLTGTASSATLASTATALAANPADCASNRYAISSDAQGNFGCDQVSLSAGVTGTLPVSNGGTGNSSLTAYRILLSGTTSTGAIQVMSSEGTAGQVLTSGGPNTLPTFTTISTGGAGTWTRISASTATRVTGAAPDALGEYRSYIRGSSGFTWSETNGEPTVTPSSADGYKFYATGNGSGYSTADTNNHPSKYEIFIGANKVFKIEAYASTGRSGTISTDFHYISNTTIRGFSTHYDPNTGIVTIVHMFEPSSVTGTACGVSTDNGGNSVTDCFFDILYQ